VTPAGIVISSNAVSRAFAAAGTPAGRDFALSWKEEVGGRKRVLQE
jgi:hypothetical protein